MAPKKKRAEDHRDSLDGITLSTQGMAATLGITTRWLQMQVKAGTLPSLGRGRFDPGETFRAYLEATKGASEKKVGSESLDNLRAVKAREIQINTARKDRSLISIEESMAILEEITGIFISAFSSMPARITGVPRERQRLNGIFDTERQRLADSFTERVAALREGRAFDDPAAEDDAA